MSVAEPETFTLLYDRELGRPGCVILQAMAGGDPVFFRELFGGADNWLVSPTPDMKMLTGTREQWEHEAATAARRLQ